MYRPPHFRPGDEAAAFEAIDAWPLALLVTGGLEATHVPLLRVEGALVGHIARPNAHWQQAEDGAPALAAFLGPSAYVSPRFYATKAEHGRVVPTWNYVAVHVRGRVQWLHDEADKLAIVRSATHTNPGHGMGSQWMLTGWQPTIEVNDNIFPSTGSIVAKMKGPNEPGLPAYVTLPNRTPFSKAAYLGAECNPFTPDSDPNQDGFQVRNLKLPGRVSPERLDRRRNLLGQIDQVRRDIDTKGDIAGIDKFYRDAMEMVTSDKAQKAFNLKEEDPRLREKYGRHDLGHRLRQLVRPLRLLLGGRRNRADQVVQPAGHGLDLGQRLPGLHGHLRPADHLDVRGRVGTPLFEVGDVHAQVLEAVGRRAVAIGIDNRLSRVPGLIWRAARGLIGPLRKVHQFLPRHHGCYSYWLRHRSLPPRSVGSRPRAAARDASPP